MTREGWLHMPTNDEEHPNQGPALCIDSVYMPDGNGGVRPAPFVMSEDEFLRFCRIDTFGLKNPRNTLRHYRKTGKLKASQLSGRNIYTIEQAKKFMRNLEK